MAETEPAATEIPGAQIPGALEPAETRAGDVRPRPEEVTPVRVPATRPRPTRVSAFWAALVAGLLVLAVLLVFILQNLAPATVYFFGAAGSLPLALAMLFSALGGAALVALIGGARILQLRRQARHRR
jgi:uncharacterized integral membrane protein